MFQIKFEKRRTCMIKLNNKIRDREIHTRDFYIGSAKPLAYFQSPTLAEIFIPRVFFIQASYK